MTRKRISKYVQEQYELLTVAMFVLGLFAFSQSASLVGNFRILLKSLSGYEIQLNREPPHINFN